MKDFTKNKMGITTLEKRLMLDASLGALVSSVVLAENTVNATPQVLDGDVTISGTTTDFSGESLTISTNGGAPDQLTIINEGTGAGQIGFDGSNVTYGGTLIGTLSSNGANGADLTIDLNANASQAAIERLIENVTYQNTSDAPALSRTVNIQLGTYFSENVGITIVAQNDALVTTTNTGVTLNEGATATITTADLNVTDPDDADTDIVFSVTTTPTNGQLELTTNVGVAITTFTLDDIVNNRLVYVHNDSETTSDSFDFTVTDGDVTLGTDTFNITVNSVNDPLTLDTNTGTTVFQNLSTTIGAEGVQFGNELLRYNANGQYATWDGTVDNKSHQYALIFTTPGANPSATPGQVLFESGGSGVGVGLFLNNSMELDFYAGGAANTPRLSSDPLLAGTQYAVVVEIDQATDEIRMHLQQTNNFNWYAFGRTAEKILTGYTATDHSGGNQSGIGQQGGNSYGGYNGSITGTTAFQGSIDSDVVITEFPTVLNPNNLLVSNDLDTTSDNIVYTITTDVVNGTLYRAGVALGLNDTFTQADLDTGLVTYTNAGGLTDSFDFSVTDGTTVIAGQTFNITIDTSNVAPEILTTTTILDEDFEGGTSGWNNNTTTSHATLSEFWGRFNRNINVAGNQELYQTFATSGTQDYLVVEFDLYELDSWDNEYFYIFVNDSNILGNSHRLRWNTFDVEANGDSGDTTYTVQQTTDALGWIGYNAGFYDQTYHYTLIIENSDPTLKLGFGSSLNSTNLNDESFGIDNLKITEVRSGGTGAQEFYLAEDAANNDSVGTVQAVDANAGQTLTYSVTGGTGSGMFGINPATGEITVTDNSTFDFETTPSYTLDIQVTDGALTDTQTITINMLDVMENTRPTIDNLTFSIAEDAAVNDDVGTVTSTDPEGDNVTYRIIGGNPGNAFKIDANTGLIEVNTAGVIDFDTDNQYDLRIRATDDNDLSKFHDRNVRINITDVDEAPSLNIEDVVQSWNPNVLYNSATGNFYMLETTNFNYTNAYANAQTEMLNGVAGHLVTITTAAEFTFIRDFVSPSHVWIALSDEGEEGKWIWTAGPEAGTQIVNNGAYAVGWYENWNGGEPNSGDNRDWALMHQNSRWYDNWTGAYDSVVEWEGEDIINNSFYNVNHTSADASDVNVGDSVGFVQGVDPEGDSLDFSIQGGNADGIFEIDTATGEIRILDTTNLDATVQDTYVLTIRATENSGTKFDEINITVKFNDDFSISANNPLSVNEASSAVLTTAELNISDLDGVATDTVFRVTTLPANGQLEHSTNPGFQISSFTLDDIQNGRISFVHDGSETTTDSFTFQVTDGGRDLTAQTFNINIISVNQGPTIATNTGAPITEGANTTITNAMLAGADSDDAATDITYTASNYANGHIEVSGITQNTFTQDDIDNNRVVFVHDGNEGATRFDFSLADGLEDGATPATGTFNFTVTAVNDAPTVTTNTGATVIEGAQVTITNAMLNATDPDDSGAGLTYTLSNINNGQVELSTSPGIPIISFTQADLDANRVVFVHDGGELDAQFDVSLADGGENGAAADTATFNLTRTPVNDSVAVTTNLGSSINQNSIVLLNRAVLETTDPDDNPAGITYTITGTTSGQLEYLANPNVAITTFTQDDINNSLVVFRHSGPPGTADFDFSVQDGLEDGAVASTGTFNLTVDNTNDAPTITTNTGPTVDEGSTTVITTAMLDSFDPDDFGADLTWTASNLVNGIVQVNGVTQNTFTQADLVAGLVTFIHDDTETLTGGFDIQVEDGGEDGALPDTDTFTMTITPVNEGPTLIVNDGSPNVIDFNDYTVGVFHPFQDGQGGDPTSATVSPDGNTLTLGGNAWKSIDIPYTLTANTVLSFEFRADDAAEIFGIGFDSDGDWSNGVNGYQLGGTQTWGGTDQSFNNYTVGDGWVRYDIPVGADFTGAMNEMVFILDKDDAPHGNEAMFRNVNFYESNQVVDVDEGGTFNITNAHINSTDPDDSGTGLTYTVSNLSNGVVQVSGVTQATFTQDDIDNNRVTFVHDGSETANAGFDISLADGLEDGATADTGSFTLIVNPVNDAANIGTNTGATMNEGANLTITTAMLNESDADDDGANLTYTASALSNGHIEVGGVTQNTFTQDDIDQGRVEFVHDGSETVAASFNISLADGLEDGAIADTGTFNIIVTPQNDSSTITTNTGGTLNEGANLTITTAMLNSTDPDDGVTQRTYTASNLTNGHIEVGGVTQNTFTQDDIDNNRVVFVHDDSQTTAASFDISLADGLEHGAVADTGTFNMTVNPLNDAVQLTTNTGGTMNEGAVLTITSAMLNSSDVDDSPADRTYTASALSNGIIQVSGVTQNTFTQDDINNNRVTFIHDGSETITAGFNISLADGLEHGAAATAAAFNITVTPVNDAPTVVTNTGSTLAEGATQVIANTMLAATDVDNADGGLLYTITALPAGTVVNTNTALTLGIGDTFTQGDIDNGFISYTHDGGESSAETLSVTLTDGTVTLAAFDFDWVVTRVNDAPTDVHLSAMSVAEDSGLMTVIGDLSATDADLPGDAFTYSIMADPDSKFAIVGNQLMLSASLDFETAVSHSVMIRADDGNGGTFDRMMIIDVLDVNENNFVAPDAGGSDAARGGSITIIEEEDRREELSNALIQASIFGDDLSRLNAFYGVDGLQILRENTTFKVRDMMGEDGTPIEAEDPVQRAAELEDDLPRISADETEVEFTNIRQMLEAMAEFEDGEEAAESEDGEEGGEEEQFHNLYTQFEDVLTYHEQRKEKIRQALLS